MDLGLRGKVAVITGGSIGIGLAVAEGLAAEGVDLVLAARQADRVQDAAAKVTARFAVRAVGVSCDLAGAAGADALILPPITMQSLGIGNIYMLSDADAEMVVIMFVCMMFVPICAARGG